MFACVRACSAAARQPVCTRMGPCVPGEREGDLTQERVTGRGEREDERGARERIGRRVAEKEKEALRLTQ